MKVILVNPWLRKSVFSEEELRLAENSVLIIEENKAFPPELYYIVSGLKEKCEARVIDANALKMDGKKVVELIEKEKPDFVGIPTNTYWGALCPTPFYPHVSEITRELKKNLPQTKIILWGTHGTIFPETVLKETNADFVLRGEPELKFPEIIFSKNRKKTRGVAFLENGKLVDNAIAEPVDLKKLPAADFSWIDFGHYSSKHFSFSILSTRGCPYSCAYCANSLYAQYRERPIEPIIGEIKQLVKKGVKRVSFSDLIFTANKKRVLELCKALSEIKGIPEWHCQTRADCLDEEIFVALKKANCKLAMVGLESASEDVLEKANKKIDRKRYEETVRLSRETCLPIHFFVISFLPGETEETLKETIDFLKKSQPVQFSIAVATPLPASKIWKGMLEKKQLKTGSYLEALQNVGFCGETKFDREFIKKYYKIIPTQIAFEMGPSYLLERLKTIIRSPWQALHFSKKIYKMIAASFGKGKK